MTVDLPASTSVVDYDRVSRHALVARIVTDLIPAGGSVLDIGGCEGLAAHFLPNHRITVLDVSQRDRVDVVGSAAALPVIGGAFDAVVALDLLEHIPATLRPSVLRDAARVARHTVVIAGPFQSPAVREAEAQVRASFLALFDEDNEWLVEHDVYGLPDLDETTSELMAAGLAIETFGSNPIALWVALQHANAVAARVGDVERHANFNRELLDGLLDSGDDVPPSYRQVIVAQRGTAWRHQPSSGDPEIVESWVRRALHASDAMVNAAMRRLAAYEADLQAGWRASADEAGQALATIEQYYAMFAEQPSIWRLNVQGPPVTEPSQVTADYQAQFDVWRESTDNLVTPPLGPRFSIVTPVCDPPARYLEACIRSVRAQTYSSWDLHLRDVSSQPHVAPLCRRFSLIDQRIHVQKDENRGIAENTNRAIKSSTGDWAVFLDHDDELAPHALAALADYIATHPDADLIYSDEDKIDELGRLVDPFFKPDWSPDLLLTVNYIGHLVAVKRSLIESIGGLRRGFEGAQDFEFLLRATTRAQHIGHIADILYHWRRHEHSTASDVRVKPDAHHAGARALLDLVSSTVTGCRVELGPGPTTHRVRYPLRRDLVSVIIPFRDQPVMTERCLTALHATTGDLPMQVVLVDNGSSQRQTSAAVERWQRQWPNIVVLRDDQPFHFQAINNRAVRAAAGDLLLFLNNDTEALHTHWIEAMAEHAQRPEVGAVGARLFYPNGLVQHAGVAVGIGGFADHPWRGLHPDASTPAGPSYWVRNFLSVTAACLMIERHKFDSIGGFDERFIVCGGDVDLGLRLHEAGYRNVMTPFARLVHHESMSRDRKPPLNDELESRRAYERYIKQGDPFYNRNLTLADTSCGIRRASAR